MLEIAFVMAPRQNLFFVELQRALADELNRQGVATSVHEGAFPPPRRGLVYVVISPHEYFTLMHGRIGPGLDVFARTIFVCAEQPETSFFEWNVEFGGQAGALFDINRLAVRALRAAGVDAHHLQLGYTPAWDFLPESAGAAERDIDVLFMGAASERRLRYLATYTQTLGDRRCHFLISDNSMPNWRSSASFLADHDKWNLLGRAKVLINLHQGETPYFEWLRVVQAMANGVVVVSEQSLDSDPLVPGKHLLVGRPEALGHLADWLLANGHRWWEMQTAAYHVVRDELPLSVAAGLVREAAQRLDEHPVPSPNSGFFQQPLPSQHDADAALARLLPPPRADDAVRRVLKDLRLGLIDVRRRLEKVSARLDGQSPPPVVLHHRSPGWIAAQPRITVLVTVYNYADHVVAALDSLRTSSERSWEVVVVDDGSRDSSVACVSAWMTQHEGIPGLLVRHPINRGLAHARNTALDFARGEYCFVLDADNAIYPWAFQRLIAALEGEPEAAFAYGLLERFSHSGTVGMSNIFPWQPERFRQGNYIDAMALLRTRVLRDLGGYRIDPRLYGWEDFDLWVRIAEHGLRGIYVPSVVARYRTTDHSMLSVTNISGADATSVIAEASPKVMTGAPIPA